jgi:ribosomal protein L37AE/L43A
MANKWDERKKAQEDEYFVKKEREQLAKLKAKQEAEAKEAAKKSNYMRCPKCGESLKARSFQKIEIDQCTGCGGIWLDAGELEQVAEKEEASWLGKFWQKNG